MSDTPRTDAILALLPGGQSCDPQAVADDLRQEIARLERELEQERALADRLANALQVYAGDVVHLGHWMPAGAVILSERALAAWKASRDPNNLEGPGPSEQERRENYKAIQALSVPERFALMFGKTETKDD